MAVVYLDNLCILETQINVKRGIRICSIDLFLFTPSSTRVDVTALKFESKFHCISFSNYKEYEILIIDVILIQNIKFHDLSNHNDCS